MDVLLTLSRWIFFFPPFYATVNIAPIKKKEGRKEGRKEYGDLIEN